MDKFTMAIAEMRVLYRQHQEIADKQHAIMKSDEVVKFFLKELTNGYDLKRGPTPEIIRARLALVLDGLDLPKGWDSVLCRAILDQGYLRSNRYDDYLTVTGKGELFLKGK